MGKWAKYTIYNQRGEALVTFKGKKVKKMKAVDNKVVMGFRPASLVDAVSATTIDIEVDCACGEDHEEHFE
jgi:hypothetical protein